jgi:hypothetical protein
MNHNMTVSYGVPPSTSDPFGPRIPFFPMTPVLPVAPPLDPSPLLPAFPPSVFSPYSARELEMMNEITQLRVKVSRLEKAVRVLAGEE